MIHIKNKNILYERSIQICLLVILLLISFSSIVGANDPTQLKCNSEIEGNLIVVEMSKTKFIEKNHKIKNISEGQLIIDGHKPIGTPVVPNWEISVFKISLSGKYIEIPESFYKDCYEINLNGLTVIPSKDSNAIMIHMKGSDGAYAYDVYWIIDQGNIRNRFIWESQSQFAPSQLKTKCIKK